MESGLELKEELLADATSAYAFAGAASSYMLPAFGIEQMLDLVDAASAYPQVLATAFGYAGDITDADDLRGRMLGLYFDQDADSSMAVAHREMDRIAEERAARAESCELGGLPEIEVAHIMDLASRGDASALLKAQENYYFK